MVHGNADLPDFYLLNGINSPALILAENGYDVWLGSSRGSKYSQDHEIYHPEHNSSEYWNFSWEEMGEKDLPAFIDFILETTKNKKLAYIGFS